MCVCVLTPRLCRLAVPRTSLVMAIATWHTHTHTRICNFLTREFTIYALLSRAARPLLFVWIMRLHILLNFMFVHERVRYDDNIHISIFDVCWRRRRMRYSTLIWNESKKKRMGFNRLLKLFVSRIHTIFYSVYIHTRGARAAAFVCVCVWRKICCVRAIVCFIYLFPSKTIIHLHWPRIAFVS